MVLLTAPAGGLAGYLLKPAGVPTRLLFIAAAFTLIKPGLVTDVLGLGLAAAEVFLSASRPAGLPRMRRTQATSARCALRYVPRSSPGTT